MRISERITAAAAAVGAIPITLFPEASIASTARRVEEVLPAPAAPIPTTKKRSDVANSRAIASCPAGNVCPFSASSARRFCAASSKTSTVEAGITARDAASRILFSAASTRSDVKSAASMRWYWLVPSLRKYWRGVRRVSLICRGSESSITDRRIEEMSAWSRDSLSPSSRTYLLVSALMWVRRQVERASSRRERTASVCASRGVEYASCRTAWRVLCSYCAEAFLRDSAS